MKINIKVERGQQERLNLHQEQVVLGGGGVWEGSRGLSALRPPVAVVQQHQVFYQERTICGIFLRLWPPTLISASIQLQYSLTLITASPETASIKTDLWAGTPRLLSTCNPLQIIADYWSDTSMAVVIRSECVDSETCGIRLIHRRDYGIINHIINNNQEIFITLSPLWWFLWDSTIKWL